MLEASTATYRDVAERYSAREKKSGLAGGVKKRRIFG